MIQLIPWTDDAAQHLARALSFAELPLIAAEVRRGRSQLWLCTSDRHTAYCVTRVDPTPAEFVIVAFEGSGMHEFGPAFINAARARGLPLRAHVSSPVVERLIRRFGFRRTETVCRAA